MSERTPLLYLNDILEAGISIQSYVSGIEYDQFAQDRMCYSAVIREFEIIGEAAGKLPDTIKRKYPHIAWHDIKDFRNLLSHEYFGVDLQIVWNVIHSELPPLLEAAKRLVDQQ